MMLHPKRLRAARIGSTVLLLASLFWAWLFAFTFWNRVYILRHKSGFRKTEFVVTSVEYYRDSGSEVPGPTCWANGEVEGFSERLSLLDVLGPAIDHPFDEGELRSVVNKIKEQLPEPLDNIFQDMVDSQDNKVTYGATYSLMKLKKKYFPRSRYREGIRGKIKRIKKVAYKVFLDEGIIDESYMVEGIKI